MSVLRGADICLAAEQIDALPYEALAPLAEPFDALAITLFWRLWCG